MLDVALAKATDMEPVFEDAHTSRKGNWYIVIEVFNDSEKDCLSEASVSQQLVLSYLRDLKKEYLATDNYNEIVFKN